jgi:hypothetical protein
MWQVREFCKHAIVLNLKQGKKKKQTGIHFQIGINNKSSYKKE